MEELIMKMMEALAAAIPELSLIDEDYGQLDLQSPEDTYPVTFPCLLIGSSQASWDTLHSLDQRGTMNITTRLAIDCYDDTHYGSTTEEKIQERMQFASRVFKALHGKKLVSGQSAFHRSASRDYPLAHGIKCYEITFSFRYDEPAPQ